jgi:serine/threonine protein kinase
MFEVTITRTDRAGCQFGAYVQNPIATVTDMMSSSSSSSSSSAKDMSWLRNPEGNCRSVHEYKKLNRIGEGTYGYVYRAIRRTTGEVFALKRIILHHEQQDGFPLTSIREVKTLKRCQHPHIVSLYDVVVGSNRDAVFLLFEYCEHDLSELVKAMKHPFKESEIKRLMLQLLSAVEYMHKNWIVHRDIKPSNLLYNNRGQLKIADFGLARTISRPMNSELTLVVVTLWYRAPELLFGSDNYSFGIDIWSVGCIFGELLAHDVLFPGTNELDQLQAIFGLLGSPHGRIWPEIVSLPVVTKGVINLDREYQRHPFNRLVEKMKYISTEGLELLNALLTYNPQIRTTARDALRHDYFYASPYPKEVELMPTFASLHDAKQSDHN